MNVDTVGCSSCGRKLDVRQLVSKTVTNESCPGCGHTIRRSEQTSRTDIVALVAGEIAAVDAWLDRYASDTGHQIVKRNSDVKGEFRWAIQSRHKLAIECVYREKATGFVELRGITKDFAETVFQSETKLTDIAGRFGIQPCGESQSGWDYSLGTFEDGFWGMIQYVHVSTLTTTLLNSIIDRLHEAMQAARREILGQPDE